NGCDPDRKMQDALERWENGDKRIQFYKDFLCPFFGKMHDKYDSTIFDQDRIDRLSIKNEDFVPVLKSFYNHPKTNLRYRFDVINTDVLGHAYENYLSYKVTAKKRGLEEEQYKRKQSGIYYTPEFLVDFLVRATLGERLKKCKNQADALKIRVIDPACGSGTFLVRAFEEFKTWFTEHERKKEKSDNSSQTQLDAHSETGTSGFLDKVLENCLYGIDLDSRAVRLARLNLFLRAVDTPKQLPQLKIIERNSLVWDNEIPGALKIERDFPLVAEAGGFDIVLGNPPWEKWKPDSQEFFEQFYPGFGKLPVQEAKKKIEELTKKPYIKKKWIETQAHYEMYSTIFRENYEFQSAESNGKSVSGDLDLYKIFTERAHQLLKDGGMCGFVVPSGIYTDLGAKGLRTMLFDHSKINALYSFENRKFIFRDIDQRYKFVLLAYEKGGKTKSFPCAFFLHDKEDLEMAEENPTILDVEFVKSSSPTAWSMLEIKTPKDYGIVKKLLKNPLLGEKIEGAWNVGMQSGFHMTNDSHLFKTGLYGVSMLEGKNIHQFTHNFSESPTTRFKILEKDIEANLKPDKIYHKSYWMAYRLIARSMDTRTFISTIVPPGYVCGNSIAIVRTPDLKQLCFLCGVMNSFVVDYFMRQKVSANINMFYFLETPIPRLSSGKEFDSIVRKVVQLVAVTPEFDALKKEAGVEHALTNENDRMHARAQLDAIVAKLYGITKEELQFILAQFPLVDEKQKEMVLENIKI
ncbi:MAG: N-6 DNA methylase, partial [Nanoarchaeota archaeon]|nr:N-6 DNA methylase [Nanoarchaeota archaeon]